MKDNRNNSTYFCVSLTTFDGEILCVAVGWYLVKVFAARSVYVFNRRQIIMWVSFAMCFNVTSIQIHNYYLNFKIKSPDITHLQFDSFRIAMIKNKT